MIRMGKSIRHMWVKLSECKIIQFQGVQQRMVLVGNSFRIFVIIFLWFVVAMPDLVQKVKAIDYLFYCLHHLEIFSEM